MIGEIEQRLDSMRNEILRRGEQLILLASQQADALVLAERLIRMHRRADEDGEGAYCPECQAYDETGDTCPTARLADQLKATLIYVRSS